MAPITVALDWTPNTNHVGEHRKRTEPVAALAAGCLGWLMPPTA